ncbi:MAG TPA: hypothetical protein VFR18_02340 [Terriglobia bacterium]|nr:hypothetical protein [Terriglobia bacterium]
MTSRYSIRLLVLTFLMPALTAVGQAPDAKTVVAAASKALGADNVSTLHYSGSGSSYAVTSGPVPAGGWPHRVMKAYVRHLNLKANTLSQKVTSTEGTGDQTATDVVDNNSPWDSQYEFWITPYGFLRGAMANNATAESITVYGTPYKVVTFTLPGNHKVVGYINDKDLIEKIETSVGDRLVEASYRDYIDHKGVKVPMMVIQKHAGHVSLILIVKDVKVEA